MQQCMRILLKTRHSLIFYKHFFLYRSVSHNNFQAGVSMVRAAGEELYRPALLSASRCGPTSHHVLSLSGCCSFCWITPSLNVCLPYKQKLVCYQLGQAVFTPYCASSYFLHILKRVLPLQLCWLLQHYNIHP